MAKKKTVLFMAESVSLSHVVRPLQLAQTLDHNQYDVHFATSVNYKNWVTPHNFTFHPIESLSTDEFQSRLDRGASVFDTELLDRQVQEDLKLLKKIQPEMVIGDFRNSLSISARLMKTPYMSIANSYWSHFDFQTMPVPEILFFRLLGKTLSKFIFNLGRKFILPFVFKRLIKPMNQVRKKYGFQEIQSFSQTYLDADLVGFADAFEVVKPHINFNLPYICLGPLVGQFSLAKPDWWEQLNNQKPLIYLNLGSTGNKKLVPRLVKELVKEPVQLIVGFSEEESSEGIMYSSGAKVFYGKILPGDLISEKADLVINNGGSGGAYQSLKAGTPFIGISKNMDQMLSMSFMSQFSFVKEFTNWKCPVGELVHKTKYYIGNEIEKKRAQELKQILGKYNTKTQFELALARLAKLNRTG